LTDVAPAAAAVPKLSGEFAGGSVAERVAERRRGSATAKAGAAAVPQVEGVQVTESPAAPTEGLTLNFLATQLLELQDKFKAQEVELMESRRIMEMQRGKIVQLEQRTSAPASAFDRTERDAARLVQSANQSEQGEVAREQGQTMQREKERREREHEEQKQREQHAQERQREVERGLEEQRKAQAEVVELKAKLEAAERDAAARQSEVKNAAERAKQAAEKRGEQGHDESEDGEREKWWKKSDGKREAKEKFYTDLSGVMQKLAKSSGGFSDLRTKQFEGPLPEYKPPGLRPLSQLDYTYDYEDELAYELKKSYPYDARPMVERMFSKAREKHSEYVRAIRENPGLKAKGDPGNAALSSAGDRESMSSRSSRRGESRVRRRGQLERDSSDGLLASFVPPRGREDVEDETRKAREEWIENQVLSALLKALPASVVKQAKAVCGRDPWATALIFFLLVSLYSDVDTQRNDCQDELLEIQQKSGETIGEFITRFEHLLDVLEDWNVDAPDLSRMKKPILAAVSKRAEVLEEGVKWRWSDWFSKVQHQLWRGKDYGPLWEVLDVAEDLFQKNPTTLEVSSKTKQESGEKVGESRTANTSEREGEGFDGCTYCWKTNHKEADCFRKRAGKPRLQKPEVGAYEKGRRNRRNREKPRGEKGGDRQQEEKAEKQGAWEYVEPKSGGVPLAEVQCFKCKQYGHYRNDCPGGLKESKHETKGEDKPEAKHAKDASTETEALASTKVEPKPMTPAELGLPEPANDIQRYIVSSMAAMANAQRESATRR
jgi:hypothetical protein